MFFRWTLLLGLAALSTAQAATILSEGFDDVSSLTGSGWAIVNNSSPIGVTDWFQGNSGIFPAQSGAADSYAAANFLSAGAGGNISTWLLTPVLSIANGDLIQFYSQSTGTFPDRLELRLSTSGASTDVGATDTSVGDFTSLLLTINPALGAGYPTNWTLFSAMVSGVGPGATGRYAFRYFVPDTFTNGDYIGVDTLQVVQAVPEPATWGLLVLGLILLAARSRRLRHCRQH